jgi:hypothetical protein
MMNSQNITVFNVELGFTALPHLPDFPARAALESSPSQNLVPVLRRTTLLQIPIAHKYLDACRGPK